jgi:hypothetical protein
MLKDFLDKISKNDLKLNNEKFKLAVGVFVSLSLFAYFFFVVFYYILHDSFAITLSLALECFAFIGFLFVFLR